MIFKRIESFADIPVSYTRMYNRHQTLRKLAHAINRDFLADFFFTQNIDCGYTLEPPRRVSTIDVLEQK